MSKLRFPVLNKLLIELFGTVIPGEAGEDVAAKILNKYVQTEKDEFGNHHCIVGVDPTVIFSSHLDTVAKGKVRPMTLTISDGIVRTAEDECLGADCKTGIAIMAEMITAGIPGHYVFHSGEERGGVGSRKLVASLKEKLSKYKQCVAFDRRGTTSVITKQGGTITCSNAYASALAKQLGMGFAPDDTGMFTDSKSYIEYVPECTNISVGYDNAHSSSELQDIYFLNALMSRILGVKWDELPIERKAEPERYVVHTYQGGYGGRRYGHALWDDDDAEDYTAGSRKAKRKARRERYSDLDMVWKTKRTLDSLLADREKIANNGGISMEKFKAALKITDDSFFKDWQWPVPFLPTDVVYPLTPTTLLLSPAGAMTTMWALIARSGHYGWKEKSQTSVLFVPISTNADADPWVGTSTDTLYPVFCLRTGNVYDGDTGSRLRVGCYADSPKTIDPNTYLTILRSKTVVREDIESVFAAYVLSDACTL